MTALTASRPRPRTSDMFNTLTMLAGRGQPICCYRPVLPERDLDAVQVLIIHHGTQREPNVVCSTLDINLRFTVRILGPRTERSTVKPGKFPLMTMPVEMLVHVLHQLDVRTLIKCRKVRCALPVAA